MELNALIEQLLEIQKVHGDIPVFSYKECHPLHELDVTMGYFKEGESAILISFDSQRDDQPLLIP